MYTQNFCLRNGADRIVYPEKEMAERLAMKYGTNNIFDYVELTHDYSIYEIAVPGGVGREKYTGKESQDKISYQSTRHKTRGRLKAAAPGGPYF